MRANIRLNIFTNCTDSVLFEPTILKTYDSFIETFGVPEKLDIYLDPHPNKGALDSYITYIRDVFNVEPIITSGLADGYRRCLDSEDELQFMLEHDWTFKSVEHSLEQITDLIKENALFYLRFNKFKNEDYDWLRKWQTELIPGKGFCYTDNLSNNPHIIKTSYYKRYLLYSVDWSLPGAGQIEQVLAKSGHWGAVYGNYGHEATVEHIDGRRGGRK